MRPARQALRFTHLLVRNWRNFLKADVDLGKRVFLVGPSASGKSGFLDILCFLSDLATRGVGFQEAVARRGGVRMLRCLAARQDSDLVLAVRAGSESNPAEWEYELVFNQEGLHPPAIRQERLSRAGEEIVARPDPEDESDPERLRHSLLEQGALRKELRDFSGFLETVRYISLVPALMRASGHGARVQADPCGAGIIEEIAATADRFQQARLRLIGEVLQTAVPQLGQLDAFRDVLGRAHLRARHKHWRPHGAWQTEQQLSDGTLRLIGLVWSALDGGGPLLVEEPEASLHPQVVRLVPRMLAQAARRTGRQVILATHSLDLLCGEGVDTGEMLLFNPAEEGTAVRTAFDLKEAADLLDQGALAAEPPPVETPDTQMGLFAESAE